MARVIGIGGVFQKANDPTALYAWYARHLGLHSDPNAGAIFPWRRDDQPDHKEMTVWSLFKRDTKYFGPGPQTVMVNYIVDDLDGVLRDLRAAGVQVDERVEEHEYGKFGWAADAEGNRIELWQPPA